MSKLPLPNEEVQSIVDFFNSLSDTLKQGSKHLKELQKKFEEPTTSQQTQIAAAMLTFDQTIQSL